MSKFGDTLRAAREDADYTLAELASALGEPYTASILHNIEAGHRRAPGRPIISQLTVMLSVEGDALHAAAEEDDGGYWIARGDVPEHLRWLLEGLCRYGEFHPWAALQLSVQKIEVLSGKFGSECVRPAPINTR